MCIYIYIHTYTYVRICLCICHLAWRASVPAFLETFGDLEWALQVVCIIPNAYGHRPLLRLSAILGHLGAFSGAIVGQSWAHLSTIWMPSWGHLEAFLQPLGQIFMKNQSPVNPCSVFLIILFLLRETQNAQPCKTYAETPTLRMRGNTMV